MPTILIVDDHPDSAAASAAVAAECGWGTVIVHDGAAALDRIAGQTFDLILLDYHMPGMSGLDVLRALRDRTLNGPPVIMFSADKAVAGPAMQLGASASVLKGGDIDELMATMRRFVGCAA